MNRIQAKKLQAEIDKRAEEVVQKLQQKGIIDKPLEKRDKHDSTGAMASAWFGTPGAGKAVDRVFGKQSHPHDDYKQLEVPQGVQLAPCPVCCNAAALWRYSESETSPSEVVVMCTYGDVIGPQDGIVNEGCLLCMPPVQFYQETIRDAAQYWNDFAKALVALRTNNAAAAVWTEADQAAWMALPEEERRRRNHAAADAHDVPLETIALSCGAVVRDGESIKFSVRAWNMFRKAMGVPRNIDWDSMPDDPGFREEHPDWPAAVEAMRKWKANNGFLIASPQDPTPALKTALRQLVDEVKQHAYAPQFEHLGPLVLQAEALLAKGE